MEQIIQNQKIQEKNKNTNEPAKEINPPTTQFISCPLFSGRHKWSLLAFRLSNGTVSYCQFCYLEKLIPFAYNNFTEYFPAGTHYCR
jgi:hypothetical protein